MGAGMVQGDHGVMYAGLSARVGDDRVSPPPVHIVKGNISRMLHKHITQMATLVTRRVRDPEEVGGSRGLEWRRTIPAPLLPGDGHAHYGGCVRSEIWSGVAGLV